MNKLDVDILEVEEFITNVKFVSSSSASENNRNSFKAAYKQYHALLIWGLIAEGNKNTHLSAKLYFRESLSDISHGFMLTLVNLYKPARTSLRSGIENFVRSLLLICDVDATKIHTVHDLFDQAKSHFSGEAPILKNISNLITTYSELCKTVHSAKIDYMALEVPFEKLSTYNSTRYNMNMSNLRSVCASVNQSIFWLWHNQLGKSGHKNEDFVRDSIPKSLKYAASRQK